MEVKQCRRQYLNSGTDPQNIYFIALPQLKVGAARNHTSESISSTDVDLHTGVDVHTDMESGEIGPPDSHEAMNNRETSPRSNIREKRSYEFLMGLINNNSTYEVIRPESVTPVDENSKKNKTDDNDAAHLLLELIVKIARHPDEWNGVHNILENLEKHLETSRNIVKEYERANNSKISKSSNEEIMAKRRENTGTDIEWPIFDHILKANKTIIPSVTKNTTTNDDKSTDVTKAYQKNFTYRRVTGKPAYFKKTPSAYIAVSSILPKLSRSQENEDILLENELHRLKPWPPKERQFRRTQTNN